MVDTLEVIARPLATSHQDLSRTSIMSQRRTTTPPTHKHSRSSPSGRKELIATEKDEKAISKGEDRP